MRCASCGQESTDGRSATWIAGRKLSESVYGTGPTTVATETLYTDFAPVDVFLCSSCDAKAQQRAKSMFWGFLALAIFGFVGIIFATNAEQRTLLEAMLVGGGIPAVLGGGFAAIHYSFVYRYRGVDFDRELLRRFVWKLVHASGREAIWTTDDFEKLQRS